MNDCDLSLQNKIKVCNWFHVNFFILLLALYHKKAARTATSMGGIFWGILLSAFIMRQ